MTPLGLSGLRKHVWNLPLRRHSLPPLPKNSTFWPLGMTQVEHFSAGLLSIPLFICWLEFLNRGWILNWALRAGSIFRLPSRPPQCPGATPNGKTRPLGKSDFRSQCPSRLRTPKPARPLFWGTRRDPRFAIYQHVCRRHVFFVFPSYISGPRHAPRNWLAFTSKISRTSSEGLQFFFSKDPRTCHVSTTFFKA